MIRDQARAWVDAWAALYPVSYDQGLAQLEAKQNFEPSDIELLIDWKYPEPRTGRRAFRHKRIRELFAQNAPSFVRSVTAEAFAATGDVRPLRTLQRLSGVGEAIASTTLMAWNPARFTVTDIQAPRSLRALGYLPQDGSVAWSPYLEACRRLAEDAERSLRTTDRALVIAAGRGGMPGS